MTSFDFSREDLAMSAAKMNMDRFNPNLSTSPGVSPSPSYPSTIVELNLGDAASLPPQTPDGSSVIDDDDISLASFETTECEQSRSSSSSPTGSTHQYQSADDECKRLLPSLQSSERSERFESAMYIITNLVRISREKQRIYREVAMKTLKKLALRGHPDAQFYFGSFYANGVPGFGKNHKSDPVKAFHWYSLAAKKEHDEALYHLGVSYEQGLGTTKNATKAVHSYRRGCVCNHPGAMYRLAMILMRGQLGQAQNVRDGLKWLKLSAKYATEKYPNGLYELALLHEKGVRNFVWPDHKYLVQLLQDAVELGHVQSMYKLGKAYAQGNYSLKLSPKASFHYYSLASQRDHPESLFEIAGWYLSGCEDEENDFRVSQSDRMAFTYIEKAAKLNLAKAMFALGYFYEHGVGIEEHLENAVWWYKKAAQAGDAKAMDWCKEKRVYFPSAKPQKSERSLFRKEQCIIQ